jgi:hypothetical protein
VARVHVRGLLRQFLQAEQRDLSRAQSLIECVAKSMDDESHPSGGPYYPDALELAADILKQRVTRLDELLLDDHIHEPPRP